MRDAKSSSRSSGEKRGEVHIASLARWELHCQKDDIWILREKDGDWEECKRTNKVEVSAKEWAFERIREAFEKVAKDEAGSLIFAQGIILKSTDFLRRIIAAARGHEGVTLTYLCPHCNCFPLEVSIWWVSIGKKHCSWWWCQSVEKTGMESAQQVNGGTNRINSLTLLAKAFVETLFKLIITVSI